MGLDLHIYIEARAAPGDHWYVVAENIFVERQYELFRTITGDGALYPTRGLPADLDDDNAIPLRDLGLLDLSWLTATEFRAVLDAYKAGAAATYWAILAMMEELDRRGREARIVVGIST